MSTDTLLVELGTEELPPKALKSLGLAFRDGVVAGLDKRELGYGEVQWFASPRRLAVLIEYRRRDTTQSNCMLLVIKGVTLLPNLFKFCAQRRWTINGVIGISRQSTTL